VRVSAIIGLVLGYFVPTWYRTTSEKDRAMATDTVTEIVDSKPVQSAVIKQLHNAP